MTNPYRGLELLAPAGSPACLHAGVSAGADAVYLGCENFNARRNADNFTLENLTEACDYAHMRGVRVYLALNIAIMPEELKPSLDLAISAWNRGVDAFIVQDIGLAAEIKRALPDARLHISTQMNTHNIEGVRAAAALGAQRITMARELTCEELEEATAEAHRLGIETECFAHGALCVCYSGQCLMSSMIGGRSANRGTCAQACRLPYVLRDEDSDSEILTKDGDRLLSPKDLCTIDMLEKLAATGVDSLKIEGRMKSPEYVFAVVSTYRAVLDRLAHACDEGLNPSEMAVLDEERRTLSEAFSRGFTEAYLAHKRGNDIMGYGRANNRGVFVGRVAKANGREVAIESNVELNEGDVLEFWTNRGHFASTLASFEKSNGTYYFEVDGKAYKGDRVFRVRDASMAFHDSEYEPKLPVKLKVQAHIGQPLTFFAECAGAKATFSGAIVEPARTKALSIDEAREHIDRLGNTPFFLSDLDIDIDVIGITARIANIAFHRAAEQERLLRNIAQLASQRMQRQIADVDAVDSDRALRRIRETLDKLDDRRLSRAGRAHDSRHFSGRRREAHVLQHAVLRAGVFEAHIVERYFDARRAKQIAIAPLIAWGVDDGGIRF